MPLSIGIVGGGVVGQALAHAWSGFADVKVYDKLPERCTHDLGQTLQSQFIFVCLPTPQIGSTLDCTNICMFFNSMSVYKHIAPIYILKSTVPIGFTSSLRGQYPALQILHSPEFLTERTALQDAMMPRVHIVGYVSEAHSEDELYRQGIGNYITLHNHRFTSCTKLLVCSSDESEAIKLMTNSFFAVKIGIMNEFKALSDSLDLDWSTILTGILADGRISPCHTQVPGPDGKYGYGGKCLPKDIECLRSHGGLKVLCPIMETVICRNKSDRKDSI